MVMLLLIATARSGGRVRFLRSFDMQHRSSPGCIWVCWVTDRNRVVLDLSGAAADSNDGGAEQEGKSSVHDEANQSAPQTTIAPRWPATMVRPAVDQLSKRRTQSLPAEDASLQATWAAQAKAPKTAVDTPSQRCHSINRRSFVGWCPRDASIQPVPAARNAPMTPIAKLHFVISPTKGFTLRSRTNSPSPPQATV